MARRMRKIEVDSIGDLSCELREMVREYVRMKIRHLTSHSDKEEDARAVVEYLEENLRLYCHEKEFRFNNVLDIAEELAYAKYRRIRR